MRTLIIALQGLRGAPIRSLLVILALTFGMLGFVAALSADQVMRETVTQRALLAGGREPTVELALDGMAADERIADVTAQLARRSGATAAAATIDDPEIGVWVDDVRVDLATVLFVDRSLRGIRPFPLVDGDWLRGVEALAPRVVVNEAAADALSVGADARLGSDDVRRRTVVAGVVRDGVDTPQVYAELADRALFTTQTATVTVMLHGPRLATSDVRKAATELAALGAPIVAGDARRTDQLAELAGEVATTSRVLFVLGALGLLSTIVGILNVGLATARGRAKEFTLRRTMGATRQHIAGIVLLESQLLAGTAAIIAAVGSFLLLPVVVGAFGAQLGVSAPPYDPRYGLICLAVASGTALLSSLAPAMLSARRDLSSAMRE